jgi:type IV pilus assembly protein PilY1
MAAQPAIAAVTDVSNVPLASSAGATFLPNLLFTLDDSGSMDRRWLPDYVTDNNTCMVSDDGTACQAGDPPFEAGGETGMNGVGYDPNFNYLPGLSSNGQPYLNPPSGALTPTSVPPDAYLGGTNVNLTTNSPDNRYCNGTGGSAVCKRNGADITGVVTPVGIEVQSFTQANVLGPGQFPYRTNPSSASLTTFGLPEMMSIGTFSRSSNIVTVDTVEPHGLVAGATPDRIFVTGTGQAGMDLAFVTVATVPNANRFTYTSTGSGNITARAGSYRKYGPGSFQRSGNTVTVTTTSNHLVVTGDRATFVVPTQTAMNAANVTITVTSPTTFTYNTGGSGNIPATPGFGVRTGLYNVRTPVTGAPAVYRITPTEYCTDAALTDCMLVIPPATPPASHPFAATVRFCRTRGEALAPGLVTGTSILPPATAPTPRCQLKYVNVTGLQTYTFPRFGWFTRDTVTSGVATYGNRPNRIDCVGVGAATCTYAEEMQNYSRWFTYYSNRMRMMKTSAGRAFLNFISNPTGTPPRPDRLRLGFITINTGSTVPASKYLKIDNFNTTHAGNWYNKFYSQVPNASTPLRVALSRAGWIFAGKLNTGLTDGIPTADDPVQASCQKNYSIFTTDGFWNQGTGQDLAGNPLLNHDNVDNQVIAPYTDKMVSRASGTYDGNILNGTTAGTSPGGRGTLADVALYYYKTDLRGGTDSLGNPTGPATSPSTTPPGGDVSNNNVTPGPKDFVRHQHMTTFTVGLADGLMRYQSNYESALTGDFANIKNGATGCFWASGICNWPAPQADGQSALDDLWHAAVNGRGTFYSALNPNALATGLTDALNKLDIDFASAAAAATSSPNVASGAEFAFSTRYQTANWAGEVYAQKIDPLTGQVSDFKEWRAHELLLARVTADSDTRNLWMFDSATGTKLKTFSFASMTPAEQGFFSDKCFPLSNMTQCTTLTPFQLIDANDGDKLVRFLRGQTELETTVFRDRQEILDEPGHPLDKTPVQTIMGDIINAQPLFVPGTPFFEYSDPGYTTFKTVTLKNRKGTLYIAANDGYLHAFDGSTGFENWAYMPKFVMPAVHQIADSGYAGKHRFFLDGTPEFQDVFDVYTSAWKTVLVGGANSGARGYYALDITDPLNPKGLWEFCSDPTLCAITDPDLGLTYGNPVIGKRKSDGRWVVVVTSGLNNVTPGSGEGFFFVLDAITGQILHKVATKSGGTTTPSGLAKVGGWYEKGLADAQFDWVYGGDQNGDIWRVDMSKAMTPYFAPSDVDTTSIMHFATLKDLSGTRLQPITARPVATPLTVTGIGRKRIVYFATGRYLGISDLSDAGAGGPAWVQSIYGLMDKDTGVSLGDVRASGTLVEQTLSPLALGRRAVSKNAVDWSAKNGFFIDLLPDIDVALPDGQRTDGERVVLDLQLVLGTLVVTSTIPVKGGCTPGGFSYQYNLDFKTGGYVGNSAPAGGSGFLAKLIVGTAIVQTSDGSIKAINKSYTGENTPANVGIEPFTQMKRFSYRER